MEGAFLVAHYDFFQNKACEYFPCHKGLEEERFSCLFCYCPLYALGENCGGSFTYTSGGIKDCSACTRPHRRECYPEIVGQMGKIIEMVKKP